MHVSGTFFRNLRMTKGLRLEDIAALTDLRVPVIRKLENGDHSLKLDQLQRVAKAYGCELWEAVLGRSRQELLSEDFRQGAELVQLFELLADHIRETKDVKKLRTLVQEHPEYISSILRFLLQVIDSGQ